MSSKDGPPSSTGPTPSSTTPPAQIVPVDLATKATAPSVAQIRIPTVNTSLKSTLISTSRPGAGVRPGGGASITMIPGKVVVPGQIRPGQVTASPSLNILAQPAPAQPPRPRTAAVATPILRGVTPVTGHLTLRAPIQPALASSIRLASPGGPAVHLVTSTRVTTPGQQPPRPLTSTPRPGTVLPVATRTPAMAAVSFRPTGPLVTSARPILSPTGAGGTAVTKTIVTQNPAGVFKPITTQVPSVSGAPVALKPSPVGGGSVPVRVPAGGRVTVVSQAATHIQVPMVPVGPPKTRTVVPAGNMKLVSTVSLAPVPPITGAPRTIQLPNSGPASTRSGPGSTSSSGIPVARVTPQQHATTGYVTFVPAPVSTGAERPVNLSVSRAAVAPAMAIPNFSQTTLMYDRPGDTSGSSVTITTLPPAGDNHPVTVAPATITPARITPIIPASNTEAGDKTVPGSPRPSILRKRPDSDAVTPVKGATTNLTLASPASPPRPESSGSSTISATSSLPGMSGDEHPASVAQPAQLSSIEPSPRKKPRKQQLPGRDQQPNISPEWAGAGKREMLAPAPARERLEWNTGQLDWEGKVRNWNMGDQDQDMMGDMVQDQADDEDEMSTDEERQEEEKHLGSLIRGKPQVSLLNSYRHTWKSRHNHFLRYSDVKSKDERRPTVNELANQKLVLQKINGWKIYHLSAGMEDVVEMENDLSDRLEDFAQRLEDAANKDVDKELTKVQELIKANIQRSKVIQDQVSEAKDNCQSIFEHKPKIQDIILKYQSKRDRIGKGRRDN